MGLFQRTESLFKNGLMDVHTFTVIIIFIIISVVFLATGIHATGKSLSRVTILRYFNCTESKYEKLCTFLLCFGLVVLCCIRCCYKLHNNGILMYWSVICNPEPTKPGSSGAFLFRFARPC